MKNIIGNIISAVIQRVGNKSAGDGIAFSSELCPMDDVEEYFRNLLHTTFKFENFKRFVAIDSVEFNPVYRFVSKIFDDRSCIIEQSNNLARHLYEQSVHPNIKVGEFYVVYFDGCQIEGKTVDAIGLFKSESRETVLKVKYENNVLRVSPEQGMSLKKLDKGCIIFNIERETGYKIAIVDNAKSGSDAHYWVDSFLHVIDCDDDYHTTSQIADFCSCLVKEFKNDDDELFSATKAKVASQLLSQSDTITAEQIKTIFCDSDEAAHKYEAFKAQFEEKHGELPQEFTPCQAALKRKPVTKLNNVKLGKDFEVKVLNPEADIERGYDEEKGMRYYKLYFNEEK